MACDGTYNRVEYKYTRDEFETVDGMPSIMEEILMNQIVRTPVIFIMRLGWNGVILTLRVGIASFSRMTRRSILKPDTVRWDGIALHMVGEDSRTYTFPVLPRDSSDPSGDVGPTDSGKLNICPQDNLVAISDVRVRADILCLLHFSCPENSVRLPDVGGPHWIGLTQLRGVVSDPGIVCIPRLVLCCDCLCTEMFCCIVAVRLICPPCFRRILVVGEQSTGN